MISDKKTDIVVIGGGPIGINAALRIAERGIGVVVVEDDSVIGKPRWCTGLVSEDIFEQFGISKNSLQVRLESAKVVSPLGTEMCFKNNKIHTEFVGHTVNIFQCCR